MAVVGVALNSIARPIGAGSFGRLGLDISFFELFTGRFALVTSRGISAARSLAAVVAASTPSAATASTAAPTAPKGAIFLARQAARLAPESSRSTIRSSSKRSSTAPAVSSKSRPSSRYESPRSHRGSISSRSSWRASNSSSSSRAIRDLASSCSGGLAEGGGKPSNSATGSSRPALRRRVVSHLVGRKLDAKFARQRRQPEALFWEARAQEGGAEMLVLPSTAPVAELPRRWNQLPDRKPAISKGPMDRRS